MKQKLFCATIACMLISATIFAQSKKKDSKTDHIGTWRLLSQKVTYPDGRMSMGDSSNVFQRKILTPTTFVVVIEQKIPNYDNKKLCTSVAGGHYTLIDGNYEELTEYAAFKGFETMKVNYKLTMEDGKLHTVGTVGGATGAPTTYDEIYVRED